MLGLALATLVAGCRAEVQTRPMERGDVAMDGVVIRAGDNSFTLDSGRLFTPPFQAHCYNLPNEQELMPANLTEAASAGEALGGRRVTVAIPGREQPLFGLLVLCDVPERARGPASRSYRIVIPAEYVAQAQGGRVSVVYERVTRLSLDGQERWWYGWVLWLSDEPFL
jgi:hypothetical protein